ncbi:flavoprotein, partial [Brevibacterium sp. SIMBA_078]|uniref:flavoprotein n=1 Tax=Brevibacterium sp. SIMBA_078 TaxID=3085816 RepID=UPI00397AF568
AELVRRLKDHGCDVKVVMTESAKHFITPLTMQAVSGEMVSDSLLDPSAEAAMGLGYRVPQLLPYLYFLMLYLLLHQHMHD